ncbi:MAG: ABC transporter substrate-binding protein, partial [Gammaproteobacteria bacterium]|nr:ABC transporter substrate-binding protein [Gammaproteobacteria bacterium]
VAELVGEDELSKRIYQSYETFRKEMTAYNEYSERAFMKVRAALEGY